MSEVRRYIRVVQPSRSFSYRHGDAPGGPRRPQDPPASGVHRIALRRVAEPSQGAPKPAVLVIDDDQSMHDTLRFILRSRATVLSAMSAEEGLAMLYHQSNIELVFLDVSLPAMSGLELLPIIKENWPAKPVTIVTELTDPGIEIRAIEMGAFHVMRKDFDFDWMNELMTTALDSVEAYHDYERMMARVDALVAERDMLKAQVAQLQEDASIGAQEQAC